MRLLIVEDESRLQEIIKRSLESAGFVTDVVGRCSDARTLLIGFNYDAVILDLGLPDGDGLALLSELKSRHTSTPVLILTARDSIEDRVIGLDAGADDYLVKPFA